MNKRGDVGDFVIMIISVFVIGLMIYLGANVWDKVDDQLKNSTVLNDTYTNYTGSLAKVEAGINIMDPLFAVFFFGFYLTILVSVFFLDTHPGYMVFGVIFFIITLLLAMVFSDVFVSMADSNELTNQTSAFPITHFTMANLPIFLVVMGFIFFIVLYASKRGG